MKSKTQRGFSLVELIVVIIIVGIISVLAIPRWFGDTNTLSSETDRLVNTILYIQEMAVSNGKTAYLTIDGTANSYTGYLTESGSDTEIFSAVTIDSSITIASSTIEFDGLYAKTINIAGYTINLVASSNTNVIDIDSNGLLTTEYIRP